MTASVVSSGPRGAAPFSVIHTWGIPGLTSPKMLAKAISPASRPIRDPHDAVGRGAAGRVEQIPRAAIRADQIGLQNGVEIGRGEVVGKGADVPRGDAQGAAQRDRQMGEVAAHPARCETVSKADVIVSVLPLM